MRSNCKPETAPRCEWLIRGHFQKLKSATKSNMPHPDHVALDGFRLRQRRQALEVPLEFGILAEALDVGGTPPLRIVDHLSAIFAVVNAGRDESRHLAEERFRALFENGKQFLMIVSLNRKDVDQSRDATVRANRRLLFQARPLTLRGSALHGDCESAHQAGRKKAVARGLRFIRLHGHSSLLRGVPGDARLHNRCQTELREPMTQRRTEIASRIGRRIFSSRSDNKLVCDVLNRRPTRRVSRRE